MIESTLPNAEEIQTWIGQKAEVEVFGSVDVDRFCSSGTYERGVPEELVGATGVRINGKIQDAYKVRLYDPEQSQKNLEMAKVFEEILREEIDREIIHRMKVLRGDTILESVDAHKA